jgi:hypothetical protein
MLSEFIKSLLRRIIFLLILPVLIFVVPIWATINFEVFLGIKDVLWATFLGSFISIGYLIGMIIKFVYILREQK